MDSTNLAHLGRESLEVPSEVMERVRERIRMGLKVTEKFLI